MSESVKPEVAEQEKKAQETKAANDKEMNFRRLEQAKEAEREARIRAEMQNEHLRKEMESIKEMLKPKETDPLDDVEDYVDADKLRAKLAKERENMKREAEVIAKRTYEQIEQEKYKTNFLQRLKQEHPDFDQVMNEQNVARLEETNPVFLKAVLQIPDEYERRKIAYEYIKNTTPKPEDKPSIKEKVQENLMNPYYIPPGSGTPTATAVDFDVRSPNARTQAYEKLKQAQRRPIGTGQTPHAR